MGGEEGGRERGGGRKDDDGAGDRDERIPHTNYVY